MSSITKLGKWLFLVPFVVFGLFHFMNGDKMTGMVPAWLPGGVIWVYLTGAAQWAFVASVILGKYDKLAAVLLAVMLVLFVLLIHLGGMSNPDLAQASMGNLLKDIGLAGGALMYAGYLSRDNSYIG